MTEPNPKDDLLRELKTRGLDDLAERVDRGEFSDFNSPYDMPLHQLVQELREANHEDLARRAMQGDFDHDE